MSKIMEPSFYEVDKDTTPFIFNEGSTLRKCKYNIYFGLCVDYDNIVEKHCHRHHNTTKIDKSSIPDGYYLMQKTVMDDHIICNSNGVCNLNSKNNWSIIPELLAKANSSFRIQMYKHLDGATILYQLPVLSNELIKYNNVNLLDLTDKNVKNANKNGNMIYKNEYFSYSKDMTKFNCCGTIYYTNYLYYKNGNTTKKLHLLFDNNQLSKYGKEVKGQMTIYKWNSI
jgi:hypothetical protein